MGTSCELDTYKTAEAGDVYKTEIVVSNMVPIFLVPFLYLGLMFRATKAEQRLAMEFLHTFGMPGHTNLVCFVYSMNKREDHLLLQYERFAQMVQKDLHLGLYSQDAHTQQMIREGQSN
jgi:hypothetical protein